MLKRLVIVWAVLVSGGVAGCATDFAVEQQVELKNFLDTEVAEFADDYIQLGRRVKNPYFLRPNPGVDGEDDGTLTVIPAPPSRQSGDEDDVVAAYAAQPRVLGMPLSTTTKLNLNFNLFRYANFCGPGWPSTLTPPTGDDDAEDLAKRVENAKRLRALFEEKGAFDDIDHACFAHDLCYEAIGRNMEACDFAMMATLLKLASQFRDKANLALALENAAEHGEAKECANLTLDMALAFYVKPRQANLLDFVVAFSRMYATYDRLAGDAGDAFLRQKFEEQAAYGFPVGNDRCQIIPGAENSAQSGLAAIAAFEDFVNGGRLNVEAFVTEGASPVVETAAAPEDEAEDTRSLFDVGRFRDGVERLGRRALVRSMMAAERTGCVGRDCGPARFDICTADELDPDDEEAGLTGCVAQDVAAVQADWTRVRRRMWRVAAIEVGEYLSRE